MIQFKFSSFRLYDLALSHLEGLTAPKHYPFLFVPVTPSHVVSCSLLSLYLEAKVALSFYSFKLLGNYDDQVYDDSLVPYLLNNFFHHLLSILFPASPQFCFFSLQKMK